MQRMVLPRRTGGSVAFLVLGAALFALSACDGGEADDRMSGADGRDTVAPEPSPTEQIQGCADAPARDTAGYVRAALSQPICIAFREDLLSKKEVRLATDTGASAVHRMDDRVMDFVITSDRFAPVSSVCTGYTRLEIGVAVDESLPGITDPRISISCVPENDPALQCESSPDNSGQSVSLSIGGETKEECIFWSRTRDDVSFRVEITYLRGGITYAYLLPPGTNQFRVPEEGAARLWESPERCLERKDTEIRVFGLSADSEWLIGMRAFVAECGAG